MKTSTSSKPRFPWTPRRFRNLLREADRTASAASAGASLAMLSYPLAYAMTVALLAPFFVVEPDAFDHEDHV